MVRRWLQTRRAWRTEHRSSPSPCVCGLTRRAPRTPTGPSRRAARASVLQADRPPRRAGRRVSASVPQGRAHDLFCEMRNHVCHPVCGARLRSPCPPSPQPQQPRLRPSPDNPRWVDVITVTGRSPPVSGYDCRPRPSLAPRGGAGRPPVSPHACLAQRSWITARYRVRSQYRGLYGAPCRCSP